MVNQAQGDAIDPAQGTQVDHVLALIDAKGLGDMGAGGAQHRQQLFAGGIAALFQQVLAEARLGVKRVVDRAHQHQHISHVFSYLDEAHPVVTLASKVSANNLIPNFFIVVFPL